MSSCFKHIFLIVFLFALPFSGYGLTESSKISILTYKPGTELYTIFGHGAIRVKDSTLNLDRIYNFGTFDFSSPFFYIKFIKGDLDYSLSVIDYNTFHHYSVLEKRKVHEQILDLPISRRTEIFHELNSTYKSEKRFYKYDFFYDNCATRIRDVIIDCDTLKKSIDTSDFCCASFRELLKPYLSGNYWVSLGVNLSLGNRADKVAGCSDFMFLPDYIFRILEATDLVEATSLLFDYSSLNKGKILGKCYLIILIVIVLSGAIYSRTSRIVFYFLNGLIGGVGLILLVLTMFSGNEAFMSNYNLIWTLPALFVLLFNLKTRLIIQYVYLLILLMLIIFRGNLYAGFSSDFIPWIILLVAVNAIYIFGKNREKTLR